METKTQVAFRGKKARIVWILWLLVGFIGLSTTAISAYTLVLNNQAEGAVDVAVAIYAPLLITAWGVIGGLILARYPGHVIGWLLLSVSGLQMLQYAAFVPPPPLVQIGRLTSDDFIVRLFNWFGLWSWFIFAVMPAIFLPLYFPTGTLLSHRWRIVSVGGVVGLVAAVLSIAIEPAQEPFANPLVIPGGEAIANILFVIGAPPLFLAILASLASMAVRYRRAKAIERQQMKWLLLPLGVFIFWLIYDLTAPTIWPQTTGQTGTTVAFTLIGFTIPVAIGIAILRYRLYDIDFIIRRTLVYGVVTAGLAVVYFGSVVLLQQLTVSVGGQQSPVVIVISTLLIAALFSPLRRRSQEFVDRLFYRAKYDSAQTLGHFAQAARDEVNLDQLMAQLLRVVEETMQPESTSLWLRSWKRIESPSFNVLERSPRSTKGEAHNENQDNIHREI